MEWWTIFRPKVRKIIGEAKIHIVRAFAASLTEHRVKERVPWEDLWNINPKGCHLQKNLSFLVLKQMCILLSSEVIGQIE